MIFIIVAATGFAGCRSSAPNNATSSPTAGPDAEAEYRQLRDASHVLNCGGTSISDISDANGKKDVPALRGTAAKYRALVSAWNDQLGKIAFPAADRSIVDGLRATNSDELRDLDTIAAVTEADHGDILATYVFFDDATAIIALDRLHEALGHPASRALLAADRLELARQTYQRDSALVNILFAAALAHADLDAAKAANRVQEEGLQRYSDALNTIDWPSGFDGQVNDLRGKIQALIDYDRRQVDVATASQVVPAPTEGAPEAASEAKPQGDLLNALYKVDNSADNAPGC